MEKGEVSLEGTVSLREDGVPPSPEAFYRTPDKKQGGVGAGDLSELVHLAGPCMSCPNVSCF